MFESFLVQVRVRGGFPTQTQVRVTSEPMSVVVGLGSTTIRGATEVERSSSLGSQCIRVRPMGLLVPLLPCYLPVSIPGLLSFMEPPQLHPRTFTGPCPLPHKPRPHVPTTFPCPPLHLELLTVDIY